MPPLPPEFAADADAADAAATCRCFVTPLILLLMLYYMLF